MSQVSIPDGKVEVDYHQFFIDDVTDSKVIKSRCIGCFICGLLIGFKKSVVALEIFLIPIGSILY